MNTTATARHAAVTTSRRAGRILVGHHMSIIRRYAVIDRYTDFLNGDQITASGWMRARGADTVYAGKYAGPFGGKIKKAWMESHPDAPAKTALARVGRTLVASYGYPRTFAGVVDFVARTYARTAILAG